MSNQDDQDRRLAQLETQNHEDAGRFAHIEAQLAKAATDIAWTKWLSMGTFGLVSGAVLGGNAVQAVLVGIGAFVVGVIGNVAHHFLDLR